MGMLWRKRIREKAKSEAATSDKGAKKESMAKTDEEALQASKSESQSNVGTQQEKPVEDKPKKNKAK